MKYTKESLQSAVADSLSVIEVMKKLGLKRFDGGTHSHITKQIRKFGIDISQFLGKRRNSGVHHIGGFVKLSWQEILVRNRRSTKESTHRLRQAMIESGILHICATCGLLPEWNGQGLVLQISHKDGDSFNNERTNLHFQCPNCHSQTEDWCGRSAGKKSKL